MLQITFINDGTGTNEDANYSCVIAVNNRPIAYVELRGHNRDKGWRDLVKMLCEEIYRKETLE